MGKTKEMYIDLMDQKKERYPNCDDFDDEEYQYQEYIKKKKKNKK